MHTKVAYHRHTRYHLHVIYSYSDSCGTSSQTYHYDNPDDIRHLSKRSLSPNTKVSYFLITELQTRFERAQPERVLCL